MTAIGSTSPSPAVQAVEAFYAALAAGELPIALTRLGDSVIWHEAPGMPYQGPEPYHGAQEVAEHVLARITADVDHLALTHREVIGLGATVAVLGSYTGTANGG
jgi:SnoaL-like protein